MSASVVLPLPDGRIALRVLSNSELRTFRACARKHHIQYVLKRRPREDAEPLRVGTLWHHGQEGYWRADGGSPADRLEAAIAEMRAHADTVDPFILVMCEELMLGYVARWADDEYRTISVEQQFDMPLVNPETGAASRTFRLGGKLDVVGAKGNRTFVIEHKSTGSDIEPGSLYWTRVRTLDTQVSTYLDGARALGHDVDACIYDVVRKPGIRPLKATPVESRKYTKPTKAEPVPRLYANMREHDETPEEFRLRLRAEITEKPERYFARGEVVRLERDERDHAYDVWQLARMMRDAELAGFAPKNPDACGAFGGCAYLGVCSGEASLDDDRLFRTAEVAHEELEAT